MNNALMKLGKATPRVDPRTLKMARYAAPTLVPHRRIDWSLGVNRWPMMKNDELGDCTIATVGHMIQAWTANNGKELILPDKVIVDAYSAITGYDPADPSTDNGAVVLDVLNYWRREGIGGHKIPAFVSLTPRNRDHVALSIDLLGGCYLGISLPVSAQTQEVWSLLAGGATGNGRPGSWGGHAVPAVNYGPTGVVVVTWGGLLTLTWEFFDAYCVAPETKILGADLRWKQAGDAKVGDALMGFDENGPGRRWKKSVVLSAEEIRLPCYDLTFSDGTTVRCSGDHKWLTSCNSGSEWIRTDRMRVGGKMATKVVKPLSVWKDDHSWEAGYLAAALDGEGHITQRDLSNSRGGGIFETKLGFTQRDNAMMSEFLGRLGGMGLEYTHGKQRPDGVSTVYVSKRHDMLRLLGQARPRRLLGKFDPDKMGLMSINQKQRVALVERRPAGMQAVAAIKTSSGTFLAEGMATHNCDEAYGILSPDWASGNNAPSGFNFAQLQEDLKAIAG